MAEGVENMKKGIHPKYQQTTITCVNCGEKFEVGSTAKDIRVEVCSKCHPFYTGKETYTQAAGRVERFKKRYGIQESNKESKKVEETKPKKEKSKVEKATEEEPKNDLEENKTEE